MLSGTSEPAKVSPLAKFGLAAPIGNQMRWFLGLQATRSASRKGRRRTTRRYQRIKLKSNPAKTWILYAPSVTPTPYSPCPLTRIRAYTWLTWEHLKRFDEFGLLMMEHRSGDDNCNHAKLQKQLQTPIVSTKSIHTSATPKPPWISMAARIVNIKLGRVGGHTSARNQAPCASRATYRRGAVACSSAGIGRAHQKRPFPSRLHSPRRRIRQQTLLERNVIAAARSKSPPVARFKSCVARTRAIMSP